MSGLLTTWLGGGGGPQQPPPPPMGGAGGKDSPPDEPKDSGKARYETGFDPTALERGMLNDRLNGIWYISDEMVWWRSWCAQSELRMSLSIKYSSALAWNCRIVGAAAVREINASKHADEVLKLAKQQEITRQHELAVALEQARSQQVHIFKIWPPFQICLCSCFVQKSALVCQSSRPCFVARDRMPPLQQCLVRSPYTA